jgi:hypothetical protein
MRRSLQNDNRTEENSDLLHNALLFGGISIFFLVPWFFIGS